MKLVLPQPLLAAWLKRADSVADERSPSPSFRSVWLGADDEKLRMTAANDRFSWSIASDAAAIETGAVVTDAARFFKLVQALRHDAVVELAFEPGAPRLRIKSGKTRASLPASEELPMPFFTDVFPPAQLHIGAETLRNALTFIEPAIGRNPDQGQFYGAVLSFSQDDGGGAFLSATNAKLGAVHFLDATGDAFPSVILPRPLTLELDQFLKGQTGCIDISITEHAGAVRFESPGGGTIIAKLIDSEPLHYRRWMPGPSDWPIYVDAVELADSLHRLEATVDPDKQNFRGCWLSFGDQELHLRDEQGFVEDTIGASWGGEVPEPVGVNVKYLLTILETIHLKEVELHSAGPSRSLRVCGAGVGHAGFVTAPYRMKVPT